MIGIDIGISRIKDKNLQEGYFLIIPSNSFSIMFKYNNSDLEVLNKVII